MKLSSIANVIVYHHKNGIFFKICEQIVSTFLIRIFFQKSRSISRWATLLFLKFKKKNKSGFLNTGMFPNGDNISEESGKYFWSILIWFRKKIISKYQQQVECIHFEPKQPTKKTSTISVSLFRTENCFNCWKLFKCKFPWSSFFLPISRYVVNYLLHNSSRPGKIPGPEIKFSDHNLWPIKKRAIELIKKDHFITFSLLCTQEYRITIILYHFISSNRKKYMKRGSQLETCVIEQCETKWEGNKAKKIEMFANKCENRRYSKWKHNELRV